MSKLQGVGLWLEQPADLRKRYRQSIQMRDETAADVARCRALLETASRLDGLTAATTIGAGKDRRLSSAASLQ